MRPANVTHWEEPDKISEKSGCRNPSRGKPEPGTDIEWAAHRFLQFGEWRRCGLCYEYRKAHENDRPEDLCKDDGWRQSVTGKKEKEHPNRCHNNNCGKPESELEGGRFRGKGAARWCYACSRYQKKHKGEDRPAITAEDEWRHPNKDCCNCGKSTPAGKYNKNDTSTHFFGNGESRRCKSCYEYKKKNGVERPEVWWNKEAPREVGWRHGKNKM